MHAKKAGDDDDDENSIICKNQTRAIPPHVQLQPISTNFLSEWVSDFNGWKVALPFPLTSWHLSEMNNCTRLADWFLQALIICIKCLDFNFFFPFLFVWHFVVGKMCFTEQIGCCKLAELAHEYELIKLWMF
jgi:hypothetical protein